MKVPFLIGRILLGSYFIYNGTNHFRERETLAQYAGMKKVPALDAAVPVTGGLLLLGGASILLGVKPKLGGAAIVGFLTGVSPIMHDFWRVEDPNQRMNEMINFTKNMALLGGALALTGVDEPWPASVPVAQPSTVEKLRSFARKRIAA
jgi:putative oxidoreductase